MRENEMNECDVQNFDGDDSLGAHDHRRKGNEHGFVLHPKMMNEFESFQIVKENKMRRETKTTYSKVIGTVVKNIEK